jgi:hypothetical protein
MINGAKAPDLPNYPFNSQLKLAAINIPSFGVLHSLLRAHGALNPARTSPIKRQLLKNSFAISRAEQFRFAGTPDFLACTSTIYTVG